MTSLHPTLLLCSRSTTRLSLETLRSESFLATRKDSASIPYGQPARREKKSTVSGAQNLASLLDCNSLPGTFKSHVKPSYSESRIRG